MTIRRRFSRSHCAENWLRRDCYAITLGRRTRRQSRDEETARARRSEKPAYRHPTGPKQRRQPEWRQAMTPADFQNLLRQAAHGDMGSCELLVQHHVCPHCGRSPLNVSWPPPGQPQAVLAACFLCGWTTPYGLRLRQIPQALLALRQDGLGLGVDSGVKSPF